MGKRQRCQPLAISNRRRLQPLSQAKADSAHDIDPTCSSLKPTMKWLWPFNTETFGIVLNKYESGFIGGNPGVPASGFYQNI